MYADTATISKINKTYVLRSSPLVLSYEILTHFFVKKKNIVDKFVKYLIT